MSGFEEGLTETVFSIVKLLNKDGTNDCSDGYTEQRIREQFNEDSRYFTFLPTPKYYRRSTFVGRSFIGRFTAKYRRWPIISEN